MEVNVRTPVEANVGAAESRRAGGGDDDDDDDDDDDGWVVLEEMDWEGNEERLREGGEEGG